MFNGVDFHQPLAFRVRPKSLDCFIGQEHIVGENTVLRRLIEEDHVTSIVFWGPPGVGKTTLARIIAHKTQAAFEDFSAVTSGIKEIKEVMARAERARLIAVKTILFVDEIHRFNRAQQDAFLPYVEKGSIILIGATTENPSFEMNAALLSRCKVFVLNPLNHDDILRIMVNALKDERSFGGQDIVIDEKSLHHLAVFSNGDARVALGALETAVLNSPYQDGKTVVPENIITQVTGRKILLYDKTGEEHYNLISALHKSMRNSDVQASVYWLARMLTAGEDPLYIARRIVRFASEDIGMADSRALEIAVSAYQACHFIGMPECSVHLTHAATYMALAPKSNALYIAYGLAAADATSQRAEPVPLAIRNAPTDLMKQLDYGKDYQYAHDTADKLTTLQCLPDALLDRKYYVPTEQGSEDKVKRRMEQIDEWKDKHS